MVKPVRNSTFVKCILIIVLLLGNIPQLSASTVGSVTNADGYQWPFSSPPTTDPKNHGLLPGTLNDDKTIENSTEVSITGLPGATYGVVWNDVTVERLDYSGKTAKQTITGSRALLFSDKNMKADNGYVLVDIDEAYKWIEVFNGDPAYVFGGSIVHTYTIKGGIKGEYSAYNLAEIAAACGGQGDQFGFNKIGGEWVSYTTYKVTPRPSLGTIQMLPAKTTYNFGDTITFTPSATDYSIYDKGLDHVSFSVYNKTLNKGFKQLLNGQSIGSYTIDPTYGPGTYEVTWIYTDKHGRTPQGSVDMSTSIPVTKTFEVVDKPQPCTAISATMKITGNSDQTISSGSTKNLPANINTISLVFPVAGTLSVSGTQLPANTQFNNVLISRSTTITFTPTDSTKCSMTFTLVPTGGSTVDCNSYDVTMRVWKGNTDTIASSGGILNVDEGDVVEIESSIEGDFFYKYGGNPTDTTGWLEGPQGASTYNNIRPSTSSILQVKFVSSTGKRCWYKTFNVITEDLPPDCPKVYRPADFGWGSDIQIETNTQLSMNKNDTLKLYSKYYERNNEKTLDADVIWKLEYPDHTIKIVSGRYNDDGHLVPGLGHSINVELTQTGSYRLFHDYTNDKYWSDCVWSITINVDDTIECSDLTARAYSALLGFEYTGTGMLTDPYTGVRSPGQSVLTTFEASYQGTRIPADWEISGGNLSAPKIVTNRQSFQDSLHVFEGTTTYTIKATIKYGGITCVKIFYVVFSPYSCDKTSVSATVNGTNASLSNDKLHLTIGQAPSYKVDFKALYSGSTDDVTADWVLKKNGSTGSSTLVGKGTFSNTFTDTTPATYSLTVNVKIGNLTCPRTITIELAGIQCSDLSLNLFNSESGKWAIITGGYTSRMVNGPLNWKVAITDGKTPDAGGTPIKVTWTSSLTNQSSTPSTIFERKNSVKGTYTVTATVNDPSYPQLAGCQFQLTFDIIDSQMGCEGVHVHMYDPINGWSMDIGKSATIRINADHVDALGILANNDPNDYLAYELETDWSGSSLPNDYDGPEGYRLVNLGKGTYTVKGRIIDGDFPNMVGCTFTVTIIVGTDGGGEPPPGGDIDGGKMTLNIYDSTNRKLVSTADGTWEREPARIEVLIDQAKINSSFTAIDGKVKKAIDDKIADFKGQYQAPDYEDVVVTPRPPVWNSKTNAMTNWPSTVSLSVTGPGINNNYSLNPKLSTQSNTYTGTTTPTLTTWNTTLNGQDYVVQVTPFTIRAPYTVNFQVTYNKCEMIDDPDWEADLDNPDAEPPKIKKCTPGTDSGQISGDFSITVQGDQTSFEVFEPNAQGLLFHTAEWTEYHARDRYPNSRINDFYAGERILANVRLEDRQRHPFSNQLPSVQNATAWISEMGKAGSLLQSSLSLVKSSEVLWTGPKQNVPKLGLRESGVDTLLMGDKVKGFTKGGKYAVYFQVQFVFGVTKGFDPYTKAMLNGHNEADYKSPFAIIANAWERQGIRNHTKQ